LIQHLVKNTIQNKSELSKYSLMKNLKYILSLLLVASSLLLIAQSVPKKFKYQGVAKFDNTIVIGDISLQISILKDSPTGPVVLQERHTVQTNADGVFATEVGTGELVEGSIHLIEWMTGTYYLKAEMDPEGGINYQDMGWSQLVSVPYALHAGTVEDKDDADADPTNEFQDLVFDALKNELAISDGNTVTLPPPGTDDQVITLEGTNLSIEEGNTLDLIEVLLQVDNDPDPMNELQNWSEIPGIPNDLLDGDDVNDDDSDPENELQNWSEIPGIPNDLLDGDNVDDADADPENELQSWSEIPDIPTDLLDGDNVDDADSDPQNEIQTLDYSPTTHLLSISEANEVDLSDLKTPWTVTPSNDCVEYDGKATTNSFETKQGAVIIDDTGISRYNPISGENVSNMCLEDVGSTTWGKFEVLNNNDLVGNYQSCIHRSGILDIFGPNGNFNVVIGHEFGLPNNGMMGVVNANNVMPAGMYINNLGQGVSFATIKNFKMDHPSDPTKEIWYASLEGPEAGAYERGTARLVDGEVFVSFSDHFREVINSENMTVMLTPLSANTLGLAVIEKTPNGFMVKELMDGDGNFEFDWEVKSVRKSFENYQPVREKRLQAFHPKIESIKK
jgi:hypothetical protein